MSVNSSLPMTCNWWWVARSTSWVQRSTSLHPWFCTWISFASSCCFWQYLVVEATKQCQQYLTILRVCLKHFINGNPPWSNCSSIFFSAYDHMQHVYLCFRNMKYYYYYVINSSSRNESLISMHRYILYIYQLYI